MTGTSTRRRALAGLVLSPAATDDVGVPATAYVYAWGNNPRRAELRGRRCVIEARGRMGTVLVRFLADGVRVTTSARAVRRST